MAGQHTRLCGIPSTRAWINRRFVPRLRSTIPSLPPIEINLPAFYNAIATRSDGGWFITTIFQRGNTLGRGDDGYGIVRADGSSQKPVEKFLENYVSRFNLRRCIYTSSREKLSWLRRESSIHLSVVASIFIRLVTRLNLRKVREEGEGIMFHSLNNISSDSTPSYTRR